MAMTRMHFVALAEIIEMELAEFGADVTAQTAIEQVAYNLAHYCETQNDHFDRDKFLEACGMLEGHVR